MLILLISGVYVIGITITHVVIFRENRRKNRNVLYQDEMAILEAFLWPVYWIIYIQMRSSEKKQKTK